ncbi:MAG TPA: hypothetical protein VF841_06885 [Anaeromyxobacter sp.]
MRKLPVPVLVLVSAFAAACGGSSSNSSPPPSGPVAGTIDGHTFTPTTTGDVKGLVAGSGATPCSLGPLGTAGVKALAVELTSYANACGDFASATCAFHPNAQTVTLLFAKLNTAAGGAEPALAPGTYPIAVSPAGVVLESPSTTVFHLAYAQAISTDGTCNGNSPTALTPAANGTLRIDSVAGPITGHVSVSFVNSATHAAAGTLEGDFSAPLCSGTVDVCALATLAIASGGGGTVPPELFCSTTGATCVP